MVAAFQGRPDTDTETPLRLLRMEMARLWATADATQAKGMVKTELRDAWQILRASGLMSLELIPQEQEACLPWRSSLQERWPSDVAAGTLLACALFYPAHELGLQSELAQVPDWLLADYLAYLLEPPLLLLRPGESQRYAQHLEMSLAALSRVDKALSAAVDSLAIGKLNVIQAYFHDANTADLMRARAQLIERHLKRAGHRLQHVFRPRPVGRKPRLGILAQAYAPHTESYFALAHLAGIGRTEFEVFLYALSGKTNPIQTACRAEADHWRVLPSDFAEQVESIRNDELDLLLILTNIGAVTNPIALLSAHRLARVQVASMSTPLTTGFSQIDGFLSADFNEISEAQTHYTERLWKTEGSLNVYAFPDEAPTVPAPTKASLGIAEQAVVFFSAANFYKLVPEMTELWWELLRQVPDSLLVLLPFNPNWSSRYPEFAFQRRLIQQMQAKGLDASRIRLLQPVPSRGDVLALLRLADVYLDAYPFAGACSLFDPLAAGLPAVVREGKMARSKHGSAILRAFGLDDLIATSDAQYLELAIGLGRDSTRRAEVSSRLVARLRQGNPILDSAEFGQRLLPVLRQMTGLTEPWVKASEPPGKAQAPQSQPRPAHEALRARAKLLAERRVKSLNDIDLVRTVLLPCLAMTPATGQRHMVDVGACYGQMARMFLELGWTADLFEPDPACQAVIARTLAGFGKQARLHPMAVSDQQQAGTPFYKAKTNGLSGLGPSPFGATDNIITVPVVRLAEYLETCGTTQVDFLKVDTEGQDLKVLASHDFQALPVQFVLIEVNTEFPDQSIERIQESLRTMRAQGYEALVLRYEDNGTFKQGIWDQYWLKETLVLEDLTLAKPPLFANIVFYQQHDSRFLPCFLGVLDAAISAAAAPVTQASIAHHA